MEKKIINFIVILSIIFAYSVSYSQNFLLSDCPHNQYEEGKYSPSDVIGGLYKPHRTDQNGLPNDATFRVLLVFVQFANEPDECGYWPIGEAPNYMYDLLATNKNTVGNYWERYDQNTESLSDWYQEVSKGQMHVTGNAYNVILDHEANYYQASGLRAMNSEIYSKLTDSGVIWLDYDHWSGSNGNFYWEPDDHIDMIIKVHRKMLVSGLFYSDAPGYACLGPYPNSGIDIPVGNGKYINDGFYSSLCSGLTIVGTSHGPASKSWVFNIAKHELGHYWFGAGHTSSGVGIMGSGDIYLGAWESLKLGYLNSTTITFNSNPYSLNDISSRNSAGEILQVPINGLNEYFLITNRRQVSYYDKTMLGDTAKDNWERILDPAVDYGKGVYVYHHNQDMTYSSSNDLECADGLWDWSYTGQTSPDWNSSQIMDVYEKTSLPSTVQNDDGWTSLSNKDGRSMGLGLSPYRDDFFAWFGRGHRHTEQNNEGIDRIYTNENDLWTKRELMGDRWDAWNIGYNEIFSPYSNPNTKSWNNDLTGIYIYYYNQNGNTAELKIYKEGENGFTRDSILKITPPSRPMGLKISVTECMKERRYPVLTWKHNMEPDMLQPGYPQPLYKRYKIFRAWDEINNIPGNFSEIADVLIHKDNEPSYTDYNTYGHCANGTGEVNYRLRYKVKAVDNTNLASVYSDFVSISTYYLNRGNNDSGNPKSDENLPKSFTLYQNYPNPFNPITKINYDLPKDSKVSLIIYDILGREIARLINGEFKTAGRYMIDFNGSNLSSGVYFYKIQAGDYTNVKRMVLIK